MELSHGFVSPFQGSPATALAGAARLGPEGVGRLVVQSMGSPSWWQVAQGERLPQAGAHECQDQWKQQEDKIVCFVRQLRQMLQDTNCSALVTVPAGGWGFKSALGSIHALDWPLHSSPLHNNNRSQPLTLLIRYRLLHDASVATHTAALIMCKKCIHATHAILHSYPEEA